MHNPCQCAGRSSSGLESQMKSWIVENAASQAVAHCLRSGEERSTREWIDTGYGAKAFVGGHEIRDDHEGGAEVVLQGVIGDADADLQVRPHARQDQRVRQGLRG